MKLKKAIEIAQDINNAQTSSKTADSIASIKLLIEAGKDHLKARAAGWLPPGYKLPGETEE